MTKYVFTALLGAIFILSIDFVYHKFILTCSPEIKYCYYNPVSEKEKIDQDKLIVLEEKIVSLNKRLDDFYILSAVIVTLLLAINIGIFVKAGHEIKDHFDEHFQEHQEKIKKISEDSAKLFGIIQSYATLSKQKMDEIKQTIPKEPNEPNV